MRNDKKMSLKTRVPAAFKMSLKTSQLLMDLLIITQPKDQGCKIRSSCNKRLPTKLGTIKES